MNLTDRGTMITAEIIIKAQFYDLDPMQIVWHGNYARFLEAARCALLDRINFNYVRMAATKFDWPIVDMRIKYVRSIKFNEEVRVAATLVDYENLIKIRYRITDVETGQLVTKAETTQVAVDRITGDVCLDSPPEFIDQVRQNQ